MYFIISSKDKNIHMCNVSKLDVCLCTGGSRIVSLVVLSTTDWALLSLWPDGSPPTSLLPRAHSNLGSSRKQSALHSPVNGGVYARQERPGNTRLT